MRESRKYRTSEASPVHYRFLIFRGVVFVIATILCLRLFNLQVLGYQDYKAAAEGEHQLYTKLFPKRGELYVRDRHADAAESAFLIEKNGEKLFPAVANRDYKLIYAVPKEVTDPQKAADVLAPLLQVEAVKILEKLSKADDSYEVLKRKVPEDVYDEIKKLDLAGIRATTETYRFYPEQGLGGHIFGFVGHDAKGIVRGIYGLEGHFNDLLKGKEGSLQLERDAVGALIPVGDKHLKEAEDGSSLVLTIDRTVQLVACERLTSWVQQHGAEGGTVVILEPKTGAVIAMCSTPDFDPAAYSASGVKTYPNPAIYTPYEPGSTFKPLTMAMAIDMGKVTPQSTYDDTGKVAIGSYTIRNSDYKAHGRQTMIGVLNESLNTGAIYAARKVGLDMFKKYVKAFGFGSTSGIELDSESRGNIAALNENNEIYLATSSFGQGITVTPLQLTAAFGVLANDGKLMQPHIVDEVLKTDGTTIKTQPKVVRQVVSSQTASLVGGMLVHVVRDGHGKRAGVPFYYVAGKTGTAQIPKKDGRGYEAHATIGSFVGFAPVDNPAFVMLVKIDKPKDVQWAESSAAPLFGELSKFLLNYYEIPPDEKDEVSDQSKKKK